MPIMRAQVTIGKSGGIPEDAVMNTWHLDCPAADAATAAIIHTQLSLFYTTVDSLMSSTVDAANVSVEYFNLFDLPPRVPVHTASITGMLVAGTAMPDEVAICLSIAASITSGVNPRRRRGRLFLGPFGTAAGVVTGGAFRVASTARTQIANAAKAFNDAGIADPAWTWVVFSATDLVGRPVVRGWVDDAFDTVRSRGPKASTRTTFV